MTIFQLSAVCQVFDTIPFFLLNTEMEVCTKARKTNHKKVAKLPDILSISLLRSKWNSTKEIPVQPVKNISKQNKKPQWAFIEETE